MRSELQLVAKRIMDVGLAIVGLNFRRSAAVS